MSSQPDLSVSYTWIATTSAKSAKLDILDADKDPSLHERMLTVLDVNAYLSPKKHYTRNVLSSAVGSENKTDRTCIVESRAKL